MARIDVDYRHGFKAKIQGGAEAASVPHAEEIHADAPKALICEGLDVNELKQEYSQELKARIKAISKVVEMVRSGKSSDETSAFITEVSSQEHSPEEFASDFAEFLSGIVKSLQHLVTQTEQIKQLGETAIARKVTDVLLRGYDESYRQQVSAKLHIDQSINSPFAVVVLCERPRDYEGLAEPRDIVHDQQDNNQSVSTTRELGQAIQGVFPNHIQLILLNISGLEQRFGKDTSKWQTILKHEEQHVVTTRIQSEFQNKSLERINHYLAKARSSQLNTTAATELLLAYHSRFIAPEVASEVISRLEDVTANIISVDQLPSLFRTRYDYLQDIESQLAGNAYRYWTHIKDIVPHTPNGTETTPRERFIERSSTLAQQAVDAYKILSVNGWAKDEIIELFRFSPISQWLKIAMRVSESAKLRERKFIPSDGDKVLYLKDNGELAIGKYSYSGGPHKEDVIVRLEYPILQLNQPFKTPEDWIGFWRLATKEEISDEVRNILLQRFKEKYPDIEDISASEAWVIFRDLWKKRIQDLGPDTDKTPLDAFRLLRQMERTRKE